MKTKELNGDKCKNKLSREEIARKLAEFQKCESNILQGKQSYRTVGENLKKIRDEELFRCTTFAKFDAYAKDAWGYNKTQSYTMIHAYEVGEYLKGEGIKESQLPDSAKALDLLYGFDESDQVSLFKNAFAAAKKKGKRLMIHHVEDAITNAYPARECLKELQDIIKGIGNGEEAEEKKRTVLLALRKMCRLLNADLAESPPDESVKKFAVKQHSKKK